MEISEIKKILNETFDNSSNDLKIGTIVLVRNGGGFNETTKWYVQTENGLARILNYSELRDQFNGTGIDEKDTNPPGKRVVVKNGISPGDNINSVIDLIAMPVGSIVSWKPSETTKTYTKLSSGKWEGEDKKIADSFHFDEMIKMKPPVWEK